MENWNRSVSRSKGVNKMIHQNTLEMHKTLEPACQRNFLGRMGRVLAQLWNLWLAGAKIQHHEHKLRRSLWYPLASLYNLLFLEVKLSSDHGKFGF
jgi:hypothetical protein